MSRNRQKVDPLAAMAAANPASAAELAAGIGDADLQRALARAVLLGRSEADPVPSRAPRTGRRRLVLGFGVAAVVVLVALLVLGGFLGGGPGNGSPEFAAAALEVAEANPRLLVTAPGWKVVRADEFEENSGELTFSDGSHQFDVHWYPAEMYQEYLRDRSTVSAPEVGTLLGLRATTVDYTREEYATMLSPQGSVFIEVRGRLGSREGYDEILDSLRPVDVKTWLSAMPPSTVRPEARSEAVDRMLRGIPLPPGFDTAGLKSEESISDEDSLAVDVGNAVSCAWVESWIAARAAGDDAAAGRAVAAMASSPEWPIVRETKVPWFSNYEIVTKQLKANRLDTSPTTYGVEADGRVFIYGPAWKFLLECGGTYHREVDSEAEAQALSLGR